jgi:hypothetical protein
MEKHTQFPFSPQNYKLMIIGVVVLIIGFLVMSMDSEAHGFGALGLTFGPILVFVGFMIEIAAILISPKKAKD